LKTLRIFISSPGDVRPERVRAYDVLQKLQTKFRAFIRIEPILWEHEAMRATATFQAQILPPSKADIVVCILWARIGMRLPSDYRRADGSVPTGTEWEFEDAYASHVLRGTPDLLVYRKTALPTIRVESDEQLAEWQRQKKALDVFLDNWSRDHEGAFKAAFNTFADDEEFADKLAQHLEKIINEKLQTEAGVGPEKEKITWFEGSPFLGLRAFQPEHAPIFFGREVATREIVDRLKAQAAIGRVFLMLLGISGCGKSSLARAGVIPAILRPGETDIPCWRYTIFRPSDSATGLLLAFADSILRPGALQEIIGLSYNAESLASLFKDAPIHAIPLFQAALQQAGHSFSQQQLRSTDVDARLLILIDQFEEIFTLERFADERDAFLAIIADLSRSGLIWLLVTLRSDMYARAADSETLLRLKGDDGQYDVILPGFPELAQMVRRPAAAAGLHYELDPKSGEKLDDALLAEAWKNPEALPLLEFTLDELYKARSESNVLTWKSYRDLGGMAGAIVKRAEAEYDELSNQAKDALPFVFARLVSFEHDKPSAAFAIITDLQQIPGADEVVRRFVAANLFVTKTTTRGDTCVLLSHEALLDSWPRLREWIATNREFLRVKQRLTESAQRWIDTGKHQDYLLPSGKPLAEAHDALREHRGELSPEQIDLAEASIYADRMKRRRKTYAMAAVALSLLGIVSTAALILFLKEREASAAREVAHKELQQASLSDEWTAEGFFQRRDWQRGIAYLARALRYDPQNYDAAFRFWMATVYESDSRIINSRSVAILAPEDEFLTFGAHGTRFVTSRDDGSASLWDSSTGHVLTTFHLSGDWTFPKKAGKAWISLNSHRVITTYHKFYGDRAIIWDAKSGQMVAELDIPEYLDSVEFSQDSSLVIVCGSGDLSLYDAVTGHKITVLESQNVTSAGFSPDGARFSVLYGNGSLAVFDTKSRRSVGPQIRSNSGSKIVAATFDFGSTKIALALSDNSVAVTSTTNPSDRIVLEHPALVDDMLFSPTGDLLVTIASDNVARLWSIKKTSLEQKGGESNGPNPETPNPYQVKLGTDITAAAFSSDGRYLLMVLKGGTQVVWDTTTGEQVGDRIELPNLEAAIFAPDDKGLLIGLGGHGVEWWPIQSVRGTGKKLPFGRNDRRYDKRIVIESGSSPQTNISLTVWDMISGKLIAGPFAGIKGELDKRGERLCFVRHDDKLAVVNLRDNPTHISLMRCSAKIYSAEFSPDGERILVFTEDALQLYDVKAQSFVAEPIPLQNQDGLCRAYFVSQGKYFVTLETNGNLRFWETTTGAPRSGDIQGSGNSNDVSVNSDSSKLLVFAAGEARIFDASNGKLIGEPLHMPNKITHAWFLSGAKSTVVTECFDEEKNAATGQENAVAQLWDSSTGHPIGHPFSLLSEGGYGDIQSTNDGNFVAIPLPNKGVQIRSVASGEPVGAAIHCLSKVKTIRFTPSGQEFVTLCDDGSCWFWETRTGRQIGEPFFDSAGRYAASFSPDGSMLLTWSTGATIWDAATHKQLSGELSDLVEEFIDNTRTFGHLSICALPTISSSIPAWLEDFADATTGFHFFADGELKPIGARERSEKVQRLKAANDKADAWQQLLRWSLTAPENRAVSPPFAE
jgi:WD40 repeat protein